MLKPTKRKKINVGSKRVQRVDHLRQPKKEDGVGGGGGSCSRGFGLLSMGKINLGENEECISENLSSHNLYLTARTVALFYA